MKKNILILCFLCLALAACDKSWLTPKPLSFYSPENTYIDADGLYAAIAACEKNMRHEFFGDHTPIATEVMTSDVGVHAGTDKTNCLTNFDNYLTPTHLHSDGQGQINWYWTQQWNGVKYANIVLNRVDGGTYKDEAERNAVIGQGYFHRAYRYFNLVHQFGNVPWIGKEIEEPTLDFYTYDRWSILEQLEKDLEFAYKWIPEKQDRGRCNKWGAGVLLMKVYMSLCKWDEAIAVGKAIIAANPMMTKRFTSKKTSDDSNLMLELHSVEGKLDMSNTEGIHYVMNVTGIAEDQERCQSMRTATPYWAKGAAIKTPDGKNGTAIACHADDAGTEIDNDYRYGRGIGTLRPSNYYQYEVWTAKEANDLRGRNNHKSWTHMTDLYYNNPNLKNSGNKYYGQHLVFPKGMTVADTIRCWYSWPQYKLFVPDPTVTTDRRGGETPWYVYRSAEVYLMLAECYYWKGDNAGILQYLNPVRERTQAEPLSGTVGMAEILSERARELYYEEHRHIELVRISYTYAKTGKACEATGKTYKLETICGPDKIGETTYNKDKGYNFYFDWMTAKNGFFNIGLKISTGEYLISNHHILWPIPETAIKSNTGGVINQNPGYPSTTPYKEPLVVEVESRM